MQHNKWAPWKANCYWIDVRHDMPGSSLDGWLFYSYETPVMYAPDAGPVLVTENYYSRTTSSQITKYGHRAILGRYRGCPLPYLAAYNPVTVPQNVLNAIARENGLGTGRG